MLNCLNEKENQVHENIQTKNYNEGPAELVAYILGRNNTRKQYHMVNQVNICHFIHYLKSVDPVLLERLLQHQVAQINQG